MATTLVSRALTPWFFPARATSASARLRGVDVVVARGGHQVAEGVVETEAPQRDEDPFGGVEHAICGSARVGGVVIASGAHVSPPRVLGPAAGRECSMTCSVGNRLLLAQKKTIYIGIIFPGSPACGVVALRR